MAKRRLLPQNPMELSGDWHQDEPMGYAVKCYNDYESEYRVFIDESEARRYAENQIEEQNKDDDDDCCDHMIGKVYPLYAGAGRCLHEQRFAL